MANSTEIREFLVSRRARLSPEQAGIPDFGGRRRVVGLRREEVALIAGISVEYYTRLERGTSTGVSATVLDGIGRALQLDDAEQAHLIDLVTSANAGPAATRRRTPARPAQISAGLRQIIEAMNDVAVMVQNGRLDIVATNSLGRAFYSELYVQPQRPANFGRFTFLEPRAHDFYRDWDDAARQTVALLRSEAGRSPNDRLLSNLVGELSTRSDSFRQLWATHNVREHQTGIKSIHHPVVGDIDVHFEAMPVASHNGMLLVAYSADPGSDSHERMQLLANWTATDKQHASI